MGIPYQSADHQHRPGLTVVLSTGNDIPFLAIAAITSSNLNRGQVCAEISRQLINEEALAICCLDDPMLNKASTPFAENYTP